MVSRPVMTNRGLPPGHFIHLMPSVQQKPRSPSRKSHEKKAVRGLVGAVVMAKLYRRMRPALGECGARAEVTLLKRSRGAQCDIAAVEKARRGAHRSQTCGSGGGPDQQEALMTGYPTWPE